MLCKNLKREKILLPSLLVGVLAKSFSFHIFELKAEAHLNAEHLREEVELVPEVFHLADHVELDGAEGAEGPLRTPVRIHGQDCLAPQQICSLK
jgi:hypothetical protein